MTAQLGVKIKATFQITTQKEIRREFRLAYPDLSYKKLSNGDYPCDTRCTFIYFVDFLASDGIISQSLANRVTL